jgi:hypothetical protein
MTSLFGEAAKASAEDKAKPSAKETPAADGQPKPAESPTPTENLQELVNRALQEFDDYQRLTAQGKLAEAGQKLEQHKRTLEAIKKLGVK